MDPLSEVVSLLEPSRYRVGGFDAGGDWSIGFEAHDGIKCYAVTAGRAWLAMEGAGEPLAIGEGDCLVLPPGGPFRLASDPALPPVDFRRLVAGARNGTIGAINGGGGATILGGHFLLAGPQVDGLLGLLPPIVHLRSQGDRDTLRWIFARMREELRDPRPGGALIAQQLATMMLVQALRLHLDEGEGVGWLFALKDRHVGAAIAAMHREPARRWTVGMLAAEVGMSRSSFAERFRARVGDGPIAYLTRWRMVLATRRLARGEPVAALAESLGYGSESAFSASFRRVMGTAPRRHAILEAERRGGRG